MHRHCLAVQAQHDHLSNDLYLRPLLKLAPTSLAAGQHPNSFDDDHIMSDDGFHQANPQSACSHSAHDSPDDHGDQLTTPLAVMAASLNGMMMRVIIEHSSSEDFTAVEIDTALKDHSNQIAIGSLYRVMHFGLGVLRDPHQEDNLYQSHPWRPSIRAASGQSAHGAGTGKSIFPFNFTMF